jgi:hypothetical protein
VGWTDKSGERPLAGSAPQARWRGSGPTHGGAVAADDPGRAQRSDSEVITVRAKPTHPRGAARLARILGLDRNPLRRTSDRAEAWIRIGVLAAFLVAGPLAAVGAGHWAYHPAITAARAQAGPRHSVRAVLPQSAPPSVPTPAGAGGQAWVRAPWLDPGASPRTGTVLVPIGSAAGSVVTVRPDTSGQPAAAPPRPRQLASETGLFVVLTLVLVALALLTVLRLIQRLLNRRRLAAWGAAWSAIEPQWTRRVP